MSTGRTALVTGANRGIGLAIAGGLRELGHRVLVGARNVEEGRQAARSIGAEHLELDLTKPETFAARVESSGGIDILVNNAGVLFDGPMLDDPAGFEASMAVMVHGPYHLIRACVPAMRERGWGRIVNVSSDWGSFHEGLEGPNAYGVAKAALNALTLALSRQLPPEIKINAMCPGWVRTRMTSSAAPLTPEQGADTAIWLATLDDDGPSGGFFRERKKLPW